MKADTPQPNKPTQCETRGGTPVVVDVCADLDPMGRVCFDHEWRFEGSPTKARGRIDIPKAQPKDPGTPIHFHLRDNTRRNLRFDERDPIWVKRSECPEESCEDREIPRDSIDANANLLKILDLNNEECELHYNLRFNSDQGPEEYDPSIRNGGR